MLSGRPPPPAGCILYYTLLEADLIRARDVYAASEAAAGGAAAPKPVPSTLCVWAIDAEGVQCMETLPAVGSDGRPLDQLCTDLTTKLTLCFGDGVTRGPPISADIHSSRSADLAERGIDAAPDAKGRLDVSSELRQLSALLLAPVQAHLKPNCHVTVVPSA